MPTKEGHNRAPSEFYFRNGQRSEPVPPPRVLCLWCGAEPSGRRNDAAASGENHGLPLSTVLRAKSTHLGRVRPLSKR